MTAWPPAMAATLCVCIDNGDRGGMYLQVSEAKDGLDPDIQAAVRPDTGATYWALRTKTIEEKCTPIVASRERR